MDEFLGRRFNPLTNMWEGYGLISIPDEAIIDLSNIIDLFNVLSIRDAIEQEKRLK